MEEVYGLKGDNIGEDDIQLPERFAVFYRSEYRGILALTYALSGDAGAAEDLTQSCFLRAYRHWRQVSEMQYPEAWIRKVAVNLARSRWRRVRAEARAIARLSKSQAFDLVPSEIAEVWDEVRRLPTRQAEVLVLHYLNDLSVTQISSILGIAEGTVKAHLHQARQRLLRRLVDKGLVEDES